MRTAASTLATVVVLAGSVAAGPATRPNPVPAPPTYDAESVGRSVVLLGRTHRPLGTVMTLVGVAVQGPSKGYEGGPNLIVRRIDGVATQEYIRVPIRGLTFDPSDGTDRGSSHVLAGNTYSVRGYESGTFVGMPPEATGGGRVQTTDFHLQCEFDLAWAAQPERVDVVTFAPADFVRRPALLAGTAVNAGQVGWLVGPGWRLRSADDGSPWPDWMVGKPAEVDGVVLPTSARGDFRADHAARHLVRLEDQVGRPVELHGRAMSLNDRWWLDYRGHRVEVAGVADLPGWSADEHWAAVTIRGTLTRGGGGDPTRDGDSFLVRDASWSPLPALRSNEESLDSDGVRD